MSGVSNHILKEEYKSKIMEDLRIKTNGNSTWLYMSEYQQELTMFCCRELLYYLDENGMDAGFELKKKTVVVNASIAMIELVPWLFCEDAASVSRDEINRLMTRPDLARSYVVDYFRDLSRRPAIAGEGQTVDMFRDFEIRKGR